MFNMQMEKENDAYNKYFIIGLYVFAAIVVFINIYCFL